MQQVSQLKTHPQCWLFWCWAIEVMLLPKQYSTAVDIWSARGSVLWRVVSSFCVETCCKFVYRKRPWKDYLTIDPILKCRLWLSNRRALLAKGTMKRNRCPLYLHARFGISRLEHSDPLKVGCILGEILGRKVPDTSNHSECCSLCNRWVEGSKQHLNNLFDGPCF